MQAHMHYLAMFSKMAPAATSLWMLPMGVLIAASVHVAITRRLGMMIGAAFVIAFYFAVPIALDNVQGTTPAQQTLLVTLYSAFSCIACQVLIGLALASSLIHGVKMWRRHAQEREERTVKSIPPKKDAPTLNMLHGKGPALQGGHVKARTTPSKASA